MNATKPDITEISRDFRVRLAFYLVVLLGYVSTFTNDPLTPFQIATYAVACVWSLGFEHRFVKPFFSSPIKITLIGVGAAIFVYFFTTRIHIAGEQFPVMISRFLFWNAIIFVLSRHKTEYDLWTLVIITVSLFMISAAFIQPSVFLPAFIGATFGTLYGFHRSALLRCGPVARSEKTGFFIPMAHFLLVVEIAAAVFLLFPRYMFQGELGKQIDEEIDPGPLEEGEAIASVDPDKKGMPDNPESMSLTNIHNLKDNPTPVVRIRMTLEDGRPFLPGRTMYLRGSIVSTYRKANWTADGLTDTKQRILDGQAGDRDGRVRDGWIQVVNPSFAGRTRVRQHIRMRPHPAQLCLALREPFRIKRPDIQYADRGLLYFTQPSIDYQEYDVESLLPVPWDHRPLTTAPDPEKVDWMLPYLDVPRRLSFVRRLGRDYERRGSPWKRAVAIMNDLKANHGYSLGAFVGRYGLDPVEYFLRYRVDGYCVHFASAMTLLARAAGLPARIGLGYSVTGDPDAEGTILVRSSDAHAWSEIWFEGYGWVVFDATPSAPPTEGMEEGDPVATGDEEKDNPEDEEAAKDERWDKSLIDYNPSAQNRAFQEAMAWLAGIGKSIADFLTSPIVLITLLALIILFFGFLRLMPAPQRRRLRQMLSTEKLKSSVDFYRDFLWVLSRKGIRKHPGMTGWEFASAVGLRVSDPGIRWITERFYEVKFGNRALTPEEQKEAETIIRRLEEKLSPLSVDADR